MLHYIRRAEPLENFLLEVTFKNGETKVFDAKPYLNGPIFVPLHDPRYFEQVAVDPVSGSIYWPNGADFCPDFVYSLPEVKPQFKAETEDVAA